MARPVLALEERALVPRDPEPAQAVEDDLGMGFGAALAVGVFDPEHQRAARVAGVKPVEQRRAGAANVEVAGWRGGETDSGRCHGSANLTEREGFEPSIEVDPLCRFSKPVPSATRPPLQLVSAAELNSAEGASGVPRLQPPQTLATFAPTPCQSCAIRRHPPARPPRRPVRSGLPAATPYSSSTMKRPSGGSRAGCSPGWAIRPSKPGTAGKPSRRSKSTTAPST